MTNINFPLEMEISDSGDKDGGIGGILKAFRERRGTSLQDVSGILRIRKVYLQAIEEGRFEELPGSIYSLGFMRAYAKYLGLDEEEVVKRFKAESNNPEGPPSLYFPAVAPEHGVPGGAILMIGLVIAALGYGSWYYVSSQDSFDNQRVSQLPQKLAGKLDGKPSAEQNFSTLGSPAPSEAVAAPGPVSAQPTVTEPTVTEPTVTEPTVTEPPLVKAVAAEKPQEPEPAPNAEEPAPKAEEAAATPEKTVAVTEPVSQVRAPAPEPTTTEVTEPSKPVAATPVTEGTEVVENSAPAPETDNQVQAEPQTAPQSEPQTEAEKVIQAAPAQENTDQKNTELASRETGGESPAALDDAQPAPTQAEIAANTGPEIIVKAKLDSWVQIRDNNANQLIMTRLMRGGDSYMVPKQPGLTLLTGNASALEIIVDGEVMPAIGPPGTVRRHVALKAELLRKGAAVIE